MAAAQKTILKSTRQQYVVHLSGGIGSSTTLNLIDLVNLDEKKVLTGTVNFEAGTSSITGTATLFTSELVTGSLIRINGGLSDTSYTVVTIDNNTSITVTPDVVTTTSGLSAYKINDGDYTVNIHGVTFGTYDTGVITITRGSSSVGVFNGCDVVDYQGYGMPVGNTTDIAVTFNTSPGWIILDLWKKAGYVEPLTNVGV